MTEKAHWPAPPDTAQLLRTRAEKQILEKEPELPENLHTLTPDQARRLLHELRVHQIELELQNEELRRVQTQLQSYWGRFLDLYNQAPVGYLTLDENGLILTANFTALKLFNAENRPFVGQALTQFILPEDQDVFYLHRKELKKGSARECELRMLRPDAAPFWALVASTTGQRSENDALWRITITDISARKHVEAEKQRLLEQLSEREKEMEDFMYLTAHDLRTPLTCVQGFSENLKLDLDKITAILKRPELTDEARKEALALIERALPDLGSVEEGAQKIGQMLNAMIKVSRLGQVEMHPEKADAGAILKSVLNILSYHLKEAGAEVKEEALPPCTADPAALNQIFTNLLDNALKYRDNTRKLKITVRGENTGNGTVIYRISDNGLGIKKTDLPKIWQILYSGDVPGVKKGEGIGLPLVRRIAEKNSGRIWAESAEGIGSDFFIEMPA